MGEKIIDIGCGLGTLSGELMKLGYDVTSVDVKNISIVPEVRPVIYDGQKLPYLDKAFDTALLITVLHHTPCPEKILAEALRVAKKVVVIEDVYNSYFQKHVTFIMDSIMNQEFVGHPHTNKTDLEWKQAFNEIGMHLTFSSTMPYWRLFSSALYVVQ